MPAKQTFQSIRVRGPAQFDQAIRVEGHDWPPVQIVDYVTIANLQAEIDAKQDLLTFVPLHQANNLSDVASASSARSNLGLGSAATKNAAAAGTAGAVLNADDATTTNARTPTAHNHAASDINSGTLAAARLPNPAAAALGGVNSKAAVAHQFLTAIGTDGSVSQAQPAAGDVSGLAASATTDTTNAANISSGTLPVARGGTGDTGTAWTAYTPTITPGSGSFTTVSASGRYKQIGKTVFLRVTVTITTNGTAGTQVDVSLPVANENAEFQVMNGVEVATTGSALSGIILKTSSTLRIRRYDNAYLGGNGAVLVMEGSYEAA